MRSNLFTSILILVLPLILGSLVGYFTVDSIKDWYVDLNKPWFNPPSWIFGPVWTMLYTMMGYASYRVYKSDHKERLKTLLLYTIQLIINLLWSILFFNLQNPTLALVDIIVLWILINMTIIAFSKIDKVASYLLLPYVVWVSFATILNLYIVLLN